MKLADIIKDIDKSEDNECYFDLDVLSSDLGLNFYFDDDQERIKAYWLQPWWCTDTCVGTRVYFFDDEAVAVSVQNGRKSDEEIFWVSEEAAGKVGDFIYSLQKKELNLRCCDLNEDIGDSYKIEYNEQVVDWSMARYKGEPIELVERILETPNYGIDKTSKIRVLSTGEELVVHIKDLDFLYRLKQPETNPEKGMSFINDFVEGKVTYSDIDKYVEYWHTHDTGVGLQEFLGLSDAEFEAWGKSSDESLDVILANASNRSNETGTVKETKSDIEVGKE